MCKNPIVAYQCGYKTCKDGIISPDIKFSFSDAVEYWQKISANTMMAEKLATDNTIELPCGKCALCQVRKRKDMSVRLSHEASCYEDCCFITLTYDDEYIPMTDCSIKWDDKKTDVNTIEILRGDSFGIPTLLPADVQKFMKRLRRHLEYIPVHRKGIRDHVNKIRYFAVGEYGGKTHRPHYHIMIFGWKPSDMVFWKDNGSYITCRSSQIEKLWKFGFSTVGEVNHGVAKYCARYVTKKFARLETPNDEDKFVCPEFFLQSVSDGGIGALWLNKYYENLRSGFVTIRNGHGDVCKCAVPRYYYNRLRKINRPLWLTLRDERLEFITSHAKDFTDPEKYLDDIRRAEDYARYQINQEYSKESL